MSTPETERRSGPYKEIAKLRGQLRLAAKIGGAAALVYFVAVVAIIAIVFNASSQNQTFICDTARLVAHVPAVQLPDETFDNFLGWIGSRQLLLGHAVEVECDDEIVEALEDRIAADDAVLDQALEGGGQ
jgi:hypothetical protein